MANSVPKLEEKCASIFSIEQYERQDSHSIHILPTLCLQTRNTKPNSTETNGGRKHKFAATILNNLTNMNDSRFSSTDLHCEIGVACALV